MALKLNVIGNQRLLDGTIKVEFERPPVKENRKDETTRKELYIPIRTSHIDINIGNNVNVKIGRMVRSCRSCPRYRINLNLENPDDSDTSDDDYDDDDDDDDDDDVMVCYDSDSDSDRFTESSNEEKYRRKIVSIDLPQVSDDSDSDSD